MSLRSSSHIFIGLIAIVVGIPYAAMQMQYLLADVAQKNCIDEDGYENYAVASRARKGNTIQNDVCITYNAAYDIVEGVCINNEPKGKYHKCPNGCLDGKCVGSVERDVCGNGVIEEDEECETDVDCKTGERCANNCVCVPLRVSTCGDGIWNPKIEQCDDGNTANSDGCSNNCRIEGDIECKAGPSRCRRS
ncbi:DUF4215 domain-containing protein [Patescibacteria group bacterium]|nr:DUF4215 domain-containing protein [Patescibacteria group bacterium]